MSENVGPGMAHRNTGQYQERAPYESYREISEFPQYGNCNRNYWTPHEPHWNGSYQQPHGSSSYAAGPAYPEPAPYPAQTGLPNFAAAQHAGHSSRESHIENSSVFSSHLATNRNNARGDTINLPSEADTEGLATDTENDR